MSKPIDDKYCPQCGCRVIWDRFTYYKSFDKDGLLKDKYYMEAWECSHCGQSGYSEEKVE